MSKLLVPIIFLVAALAGGGGGYFAKQILAGKSTDEDADAKGDGEHDDGEHKDDGHGEGNHSGEKDSHDSHGDVHDDEHADDHDDRHSEKKKKKYAESGDKGKGDSLAEGVGYFKFSRQFVVPLIAEQGVGALVILELNLEMQSEAADSFYYREPKYRDILMQELLDLANEGRFDGRLTDRRNLDGIRADLLTAVQDIAGEAVEDVLILDIMRQKL
ncbi:MAG: hypothetical protein AAF720_04495 [Pseudomonadota bacterium]